MLVSRIAAAALVCAAWAGTEAWTQETEGRETPRSEVRDTPVHRWHYHYRLPSMHFRHLSPKVHFEQLRLPKMHLKLNQSHRWRFDGSRMHFRLPKLRMYIPKVRIQRLRSSGSVAI